MCVFKFNGAHNYYRVVMIHNLGVLIYCHICNFVSGCSNILHDTVKYEFYRCTELLLALSSCRGVKLATWHNIHTTTAPVIKYCMYTCSVNVDTLIYHIIRHNYRYYLNVYRYSIYHDMQYIVLLLHL